MKDNRGTKTPRAEKPFVTPERRWRWARMVSRLVVIMLLLPAAASAGMAKSSAGLSIIGRDGRIPLPKRFAKLGDSIGLLRYNRRNLKTGKIEDGYCTATCIDDHHVLTAAHCVMGVRKRIGEVVLGNVTFTLYGNFNPFERLTLRIAGYSDAETREKMIAGPGDRKSFSGAHSIDWAILQLDPQQRCPHPLKLMPISVRKLLRLKGRKLFLVGYQGDKIERHGDYRLYYSSCRAHNERIYRKLVRKIEKRFGRRVLLNDCDAWPGASGSPIFITGPDGEPRIVAIHSGTKWWIRKTRTRKGRIIRRIHHPINVAAPVSNFKAILTMLEEQDRKEKQKLNQVICPPEWCKGRTINGVKQ